MLHPGDRDVLRVRLPCTLRGACCARASSASAKTRHCIGYGIARRFHAGRNASCPAAARPTSRLPGFAPGYRRPRRGARCYHWPSHARPDVRDDPQWCHRGHCSSLARAARGAQGRPRRSARAFVHARNHLWSYAGMASASADRTHRGWRVIRAIDTGYIGDIASPRLCGRLCQQGRRWRFRRKRRVAVFWPARVCRSCLKPSEVGTGQALTLSRRVRPV